jgi:hypothetical protein
VPYDPRHLNMLEPTIESRLAELEIKILGAQPVINTNDRDISTRLDKLMRSVSTSTAAAAAAAAHDKQSSFPSSSTMSNINTDMLISQRSALHEDYRTIDRLLSELDISPTAGPTATATNTAAATGGGGGEGSMNSFALLFRQMEILASYETMKRDMDLLAQIRDLTSIGSKSDTLDLVGERTSTATSSSSSSRVVNCPIISSERYNLPSNPETIQQLDAICLRVARIIERCTMTSHRADCMLQSYGAIMMALSEKMVLMEEQIRSLQ